jgi:hypothetical protein
MKLIVHLPCHGPSRLRLARQETLRFSIGRAAGGNALSGVHRRHFYLSGLLVCGSCPADYTIRGPTVIPRTKQTIAEGGIFAIGTIAVGDFSEKAARAFIQSLCLDIKADSYLHVQFVLASRYWY